MPLTGKMTGKGWFSQETHAARVNRAQDGTGERVNESNRDNVDVREMELTGLDS